MLIAVVIIKYGELKMRTSITTLCAAFPCWTILFFSVMCAIAGVDDDTKTAETKPLAFAWDIGVIRKGCDGLALVGVGDTSTGPCGRIPMHVYSDFVVPQVKEFEKKNPSVRLLTAPVAIGDELDTEGSRVIGTTDIFVQKLLDSCSVNHIDKLKMSVFDCVVGSRMEASGWHKGKRVTCSIGGQKAVLRVIERVPETHSPADRMVFVNLDSFFRFSCHLLSDDVASSVRHEFFRGQHGEKDGDTAEDCKRTISAIVVATDGNDGGAIVSLCDLLEKRFPIHGVVPYRSWRAIRGVIPERQSGETAVEK